MSTFLANGNPIFSIGPGNLPKNPPGWMILYIFIFDIIILQKPYKELSISSWLINDFNFTSCELIVLHLHCYIASYLLVLH